MEEVNRYSKEADVAMLRSIFGAVPIVGGLLNEVIFDIRGRVKQERLNAFVDLLTEYFKDKSGFDMSQLDKEDLGDLFEAVIKNVLQTKSKAKHKRYRDILVKNLEHEKFDFTSSSRFLDLIASLEEIEIIILSELKVFNWQFRRDKEDLRLLKQEFESSKESLSKEMQLSAQGYANNKSRIEIEITDIKIRIKEYDAKFTGLESRNDSSYYDIDDIQFAYYKQNLYSKALLIDMGVGTFGYVPFARMGITEFGEQFLQFLEKED